jgi:hypothetical protein
MLSVPLSERRMSMIEIRLFVWIDPARGLTQTSDPHPFNLALPVHPKEGVAFPGTLTYDPMQEPR